MVVFIVDDLEFQAGIPYPPSELCQAQEPLRDLTPGPKVMRDASPNCNVPMRNLAVLDLHSWALSPKTQKKQRNQRKDKKTRKSKKQGLEGQGFLLAIFLVFLCVFALYLRVWRRETSVLFCWLACFLPKRPTHTKNPTASNRYGHRTSRQ